MNSPTYFLLWSSLVEIFISWIERHFFLVDFMSPLVCLKCVGCIIKLLECNRNKATIGEACRSFHALRLASIRNALYIAPPSSLKII